MSDADQAPPAAPQPAPGAKGAGSIHLFRFAGVDVWLSWWWFAILAYFIYSRKESYLSPEWAGFECLGLFCIVLLHEFGHAFACRSTGGKADRIVLWPLGGVAYVQPPQRPGAQLWSIATGPLVNVALMPLLSGFHDWGMHQPWAPQAPDLLECADRMREINMVLLTFNMLPVYPLDGGQILRALLWFVIGRAHSLMVASVTGFAAAVAAVLAALQNGEVHIPYTQLDISPMWCFFTAFYMIQRSAAAFKQAQAMGKVQKMERMEGFACPGCGEKPFAEELWACDACKTRFNPFATGAVCPQCGNTHEKTTCPFCREKFELARWRR